MAPDVSTAQARFDIKRTEIAKNLYSLRQYLDIHRLINLNLADLSERERGRGFWYICAGTNMDAIAISICKMFERDDARKRNAIPGAIADLEGLSFEPWRFGPVLSFCRLYGASSSIPFTALFEALAGLETAQGKAFEQLRVFRNKVGAHTEFGHFRAEHDLPSYHELDSIFDFARGFVDSSGALFDWYLAPFGGQAEEGLIKILQRLGISHPRIDFADPKPTLNPPSKIRETPKDEI